MGLRPVLRAAGAWLIGGCAGPALSCAAQTPIVPSTTLGQQQKGPVYPPGTPGTRVTSRADSADNPYVLPPGTRAEGCPQPLAHVSPGSTVTSGDWAELERSGCDGACPAYRVRLGANGTVEWHGLANVASMGNATGAADPGASANLIQRLRDHGFEQLCAVYTRRHLGVPSASTRISIGGAVHAVRDDEDSAPAWLRDFDDEIEAAADTHRRRHGDPSREYFGGAHLAVDARRPKPGRTQLMRLSAGPDLAATRLLLDQARAQGVSVDQADSSGWTALMDAAGAGSLSQVKLLLSAGADAGKRSLAGESVLFAALESTDAPRSKLQVLAAAGANATVARNDGATLLMLAATHYQLGGLLQSVIGLGLDPRAKDSQG